MTERPDSSDDETRPAPAGEPALARDAMFESVYAQLKAIAARQRHARHDATLDTTALVHEAYLRIGDHARFAHPAQFFAYAAKAMRHLLTDRARERLSQRAGGEWLRVTLNGDDPDAPPLASAEQALALDEALGRLERADPRAAQVVELRYFSGLTLEAVAELLGVTRRTVDRDWRFARAWLHDVLG